LVNLFNSSKLKNRIAMMNTKKTSVRQLYKYAFILPVLFFSYFIIHPLKSRAAPFPEPKLVAEHNFSKLQDTTLPMSQLKTYEGYYTFQFEPGKDAYIHIGATENGIVLKQMWDGKEIRFIPQSPLDFQNDGGNFPLKFTKDDKGAITQVLAFNRDLWNKTDDYKPQVIKTVHLSPDQLKVCAGKYKFRFNNDEKDSYIEIRVVENNLVLKQMWDEKEFMFVPLSPLEFSGKDDPGFPLKFIKGNNGAVTQVLAFNRDLWNRVKE
jgi:uncharacterized protein YjhX (UPF0386 family)